MSTMSASPQVPVFDLKSVEVRPLPSELIREAAVLAAAAFIDNPLYSYVYGPDPESRRSELEFLFERNIGVHYRNPEVCYCGIDKSLSPPRMCCFFMLADKETSNISLCQKISSGVLWIPFRIGYGAFKRLLEIADYADSLEEAMVPAGTDFLRLGRMVVHPAYQGKGSLEYTIVLFDDNLFVVICNIDVQASVVNALDKPLKMRTGKE
jgi:hypothetical protein